MERRFNNGNEVKELIKRTWVAVVDDQSDWAMILSGIVKDSFNIPQEEQIPFHGFLSCESFLGRVSDYEICLLDGDFGPGKMKGPDAVPLIRQRKRSIFIVGSSSEPLLNKEFRRANVNLVVNKSKLITKVPQILQDFLTSRR